MAAVLNSSLFYFWFVTYSDVYQLALALGFAAIIEGLAQKAGRRLGELNSSLMKNLRKNSVRRKIPYQKTGLVEYDEFYPRLSKDILDEIDQVLAEHYGFTDEELDFVINYDIKYRMGRDVEADDE